MATQNGLNNSSAPFTVTTGTLTVSAGNAIITNNTSPVLMELICTSNDTILGTIGILKQHGAGNAVVTGDSIGQISFLGFDGTNYVQTGVMQSISSGTIAANRVAGSLIFGTHPDSTSGGLNATTRLTIAPAGNLTLSAPDSGIAINSFATYGQSGLGATTQIMIIDSTGNIGSSSAITSSSALLTAGGTLSSVGAADYRAPSDNGLSATEALIQIPIPVACTLSNLYVNVTANASTTNVTVTVRKNGSSTAIVATITALTTGAFTDTTHSATFAAGDLISYQISASTVGVVTGSIGLKLVG